MKINKITCIQLHSGSILQSLHDLSGEIWCDSHFLKKTIQRHVVQMKWATPIWVIRTEKMCHKLDGHKEIYVDWFWMLNGGLSSRVTSFGYLTGTYWRALSLLIIHVWVCVVLRICGMVFVSVGVCMCVKVHIDESTWGSQRSGSDGFLQALFSFYLLFMKRTLSLNLKLDHGFGQAFQPMNFRNPFVSDAHHLRVPGTFCHTRLLI